MQKHNLINEFPEFEQKIHELKVSDNHFKKMIEEYSEVDHKIYLINTGVEVIIDEELHKLKAHLLHLKDGILEILKK